MDDPQEKKEMDDPHAKKARSGRSTSCRVSLSNCHRSPHMLVTDQWSEKRAKSGVYT